uniref:NADH-ubiquinone oxidoreductase chain 4 n=1 Tax=Nerophis ophidion TaxID=159077 RepID=A0A6B9SB14_9TELE|nr:NADH dehydrogenase subunit 4 [Nerophis ophidion]
MLKILIPTLMLLPTIWLTPFKWLWSATLTHSATITLISLYWLKTCETGWTETGVLLATDSISTPYLALSCWLTPLMILASQYHMLDNPHPQQRVFLMTLVTLQILLILAFSACNLIVFYLMFEATIIPIILITTRWGNQPERLKAGDYLVFYTLVGSLPLLVVLLLMENITGSLSLLIEYIPFVTDTTIASKFLWAATTLSFLVKMPMYGVHLWLPKAHVEAPIAGSMVLAAVLLKLGGYGLIRVMDLLGPNSKGFALPFIVIALWGAVMAGSICMRQTDIKALVAYSSVSHMGMVIAAILIQTPWALKGAMILMFAHGLVSASLFCLANFYYERTNSRTLLLARGMQVIFPFLGAWWLLSILANVALPPLPNYSAELFIATSLFKWSPWTFVFVALGLFITAVYSFFMFLISQRGPVSQQFIEQDLASMREHLLTAIVLLPLVFLIFKPHLIWGFNH